MHIAIIGNGVAGMECALTLRKADPRLEISIISEESDHFFARTALMWVLCGQMSHRDIEPYERDVYETQRFRRVRDRVLRIDSDERTLHFAKSADPLHFDKLVIACGSRPRHAPWDGADAVGVGHFVTLQNLEWLECELHGGPSRAGRPPNADALSGTKRDGSPYQLHPQRARPAKLQPAVIGGGLIGIEAIECFVSAGLQPHFFIREEWFWPMALDPREARWIAERMERHGVHVHLEHNVEQLESEQGALRAIATDQGRFDANLCVVAIGVVPNTGWLRESGIALGERGGILVDHQQKTQSDHIYAAGDCAAVPQRDGGASPEQLWYTSRDQGRVAARALLGQKISYERGPWYNSAKLMDIEFTTVGDMHDEKADTYFYEEEGAVRSTTRILSRGGEVTGFNLLGRRWDHVVLKRWIEEKREQNWVIKNLNEASFDTEFVPPIKLGKG